jgi:hypothetical protein
MTVRDWERPGEGWLRCEVAGRGFTIDRDARRVEIAS